MQIDNRLKLEELIAKRRHVLKSIYHFDNLFYELTRKRVRNAVEEINQILANMSDDHMKVFFDSPYENIKTPYFILIQLFIDTGVGRRNIYLEDTKNNPSLKLEGSEYNATVTFSYKLQNDNNFKKLETIDISKIDDILIETTLIDFIDKVYNN